MESPVHLLEHVIAPQENAAVIVIFGGSPLRRHQVLSLIQRIGGITAYAALSEPEGMEMLRSYQADVVLIGGRYSAEQRARIKNYVSLSLPSAKVTEPGYDYHYSDENIKQAIINLLNP